MKLFLTLAWRNLWRHRRRTMIIVIAMGMGMSLMMIYDGFVAGFEQSIYANAIKVLGGNIQIHAPGYAIDTIQTPLLPVPNDVSIAEQARKIPKVLAAGRRINTSGLVTNREGAFPVSIVGIEPQEESKVSLIAQNIKSGTFLETADGDQILIGYGLAEAMGVTLGDRITLVGKSTHDQMRQRTMTISGIYDIGMKDIEKRTVYITLREAQSLYNLTNSSSEISISLEKLGQEDAVMAKLVPITSGLEVGTWKSNFPELSQALGTKNYVMDVFSVIILFIAGIGILNLEMMAVYERRREIGVLGALGMRPNQISLLFLMEGALLGVIGLAAGVAFGMLFNFVFSKVGIDYSQFSSMTDYTALITGKVYSTMGFEKIGMRSITVVIIAIIAAFYPAREASHNEPAISLHTV